MTLFEGEAQSEYVGTHALVDGEMVRGYRGAGKVLWCVCVCVCVCERGCVGVCMCVYGHGGGADRGALPTFSGFALTARIIHCNAARCGDINASAHCRNAETVA